MISEYLGGSPVVLGLDSWFMVMLKEEILFRPPSVS